MPNGKKNKSRDLEFLREMKERLERARNGDETEFDFLTQMIDDWIDELAVGHGGMVWTGK